jgi:hypothetical protein
MLHTYIASVVSGCCVWFAMVYKCFSCVFASVLDACSSCFICLRTYVASGCFKNRSDIAHVVMWSNCHNPLLLLLGCSHGLPCRRLRAVDAFDPRHTSVGGVRQARQARSCFVTTLRGYERAFVTGTGAHFYYMGTGRGAVDALEREYHPDTSCGRTSRR